MPIRSIQQAGSLEGQRVLVRVDLNAPIQNGRVLDDNRLRASLPTIQYLIEQKAKILLVTHLGRPKGKVVDALRVDPIAKRLSALLKRKVKKLETQNLKLEEKEKISIEAQIEHMKDGDIVMLENIRFSPDEKKNTGTLAKDLASLADMFVLDGFAVAHRAAASVVGIAEYIPSYAGLLFEKEITTLSRLLKDPAPPFVVILGGIKMATKVPLMRRLLAKTHSILVGGGIFNTYLRAAGFGIGDSLVDNQVYGDALAYCSQKGVVEPVDVVVGHKDGSHNRVVDVHKQPHEICSSGEAIFDIGPKTIALFEQHIDGAGTLLWNGAMGYFEQPPYDAGTAAVAHAIAARSRGGAHSVIGGGETLQSVEALGLTKDMRFVSTGGGAMLAYLGGRKLPGIRALDR